MSAGDEVEEFAALLRRLKDRTDRSYGSLARRVNMNTSTLHRYCAGEAVPQDFAPVERLAAFCEATPEERLELHRLWLLAVAARQRVRAGQGAVEPAGPETETEAEARTKPGAETEPGSETEAAAGPGTETAAGPGTETAAGPETEVAAGPGTEVVAEAGTEVAPPTGPVARAPWYRRRRTFLGAAVATVLLVTLSSLSALSADRSPDDSAQAPGHPRTATGASHHRPSASATGPSPSSSSAAPSSSGARDSASPRPKDGTPAAGKSDAPVGTGVPLAWTADSQVWEGGCMHDYVIDKSPDQVPPPPVPQDAAAWAATQGAVHGRKTMVQISVQGKSSTAVVLEALRVRVAGRGTPVKGTTYDMAQGCGGGLGPRYFDVNLDIDRPIARAVPGVDASGAHVPAVQFPYRVSAQDPEVLLVTATTEMYDCGWYLELDWSSQGRTGTVRIDDHGRPFRTTSIKGLPRYWYGTNGHGVRQWVPADS
ncbi:transcriptional regulator [Streptomyces cylindrosporus]|uniref:Helix-turn-helix domain-containing protein n=1 Tax=Streptomyces cylindrosporus TaxID=2927583 RepID=A0ABS9Y2P1_9ACTN|nr:transcriptional regulator [Streptomyces cylindrosporus]MCI3271478.1 helix-turn-helix domain-containing protein [Streptomyces cylindrosporus]